MAINPIEILKDVISSVAHTITISSVDSLGASAYKLNTTNTLYLRTALAKKFITIDAVDYFVTDFSINSYITVKAVDGTDQPVTATSFTINPPLFVWGNPQMVSAELVKRVANGTVIWPYMWIVETGTTDGNLDPASAVKETRNFNIFFLDSADKTNWTIEQHYDNDIYTLNNYIDFFIQILKSRRDLFDTDSITYNKDNHINFGDYIVDEGMKEHILNGEITGIQFQFSLPFIFDTCTDVTITPMCNPVGNSMNAAVLTPAISGTTKTFVITHADLSAVVVTETSDSATAFVGTVPNAGGGSNIYNILFDGVDTGSDVDFDGTNQTITLT